MQRQTFMTTPSNSYLRGEDQPFSLKRKPYMVTYTNFLSSDADHSTDRPYHQVTKTSSKQFKDVHKNSNQKESGESLNGRKLSQRSDEKYNSTYHFMKGDHHEAGCDDRIAINRQVIAPTLNTVAAPTKDEDYTPARKILNHHQVSEGVRKTLYYD